MYRITNLENRLLELQKREQSAIDAGDMREMRKTKTEIEAIQAQIASLPLELHNDDIDREGNSTDYGAYTNDNQCEIGSITEDLASLCDTAPGELSEVANRNRHWSPRPNNPDELKTLAKSLITQLSGETDRKQRENLAWRYRLTIAKYAKITKSRGATLHRLVNQMHKYEEIDIKHVIMQRG